jgi:WD40 repeat protein
VSKKYLPKFPRRLDILEGKETHWPAVLNTCQGHNGFVTSVAFSPNGKHIASGSNDKTIRVWDADTSQSVSGPFTGHNNSVTSVAFSPDGKHIASGSYDKTIRVWDVDTGQIMSGPFTGHDEWVTSVAFSSDGKHIVHIWVWRQDNQSVGC